jgi:hypothetical protein
MWGSLKQVSLGVWGSKTVKAIIKYHLKINIVGKGLC